MNKSRCQSRKSRRPRGKLSSCRHLPAARSSYVAAADITARGTCTKPPMMPVLEGEASPSDQSLFQGWIQGLGWSCLKAMQTMAAASTRATVAWLLTLAFVVFYANTTCAVWLLAGLLARHAVKAAWTTLPCVMVSQVVLHISASKQLVVLGITLAYALAYTLQCVLVFISSRLRQPATGMVTKPAPPGKPKQVMLLPNMTHVLTLLFQLLLWLHSHLQPTLLLCACISASISLAFTQVATGWLEVCDFPKIITLTGLATIFMIRLTSSAPFYASICLLYSGVSYVRGPETALQLVFMVLTLRLLVALIRSLWPVAPILGLCVPFFTNSPGAYKAGMVLFTFFTDSSGAYKAGMVLYTVWLLVEGKRLIPVVDAIEKCVCWLYDSLCTHTYTVCCSMSARLHMASTALLHTAVIRQALYTFHKSGFRGRSFRPWSVVTMLAQLQFVSKLGAAHAAIDQQAR